MAIRLPQYRGYLTHLTSLTLGTKQLMHIMKIESVVPAAWINTWNYLQKLAIESVFLHLGLAMECEQLFTYGLSYYSAWFIRASVWDCRMYYARFVTVFDGYFETFSSRIYCKLLLLSIG
eukprot:574942_1